MATGREKHKNIKYIFLGSLLLTDYSITIILKNYFKYKFGSLIILLYNRLFLLDNK